MDHMMPVMDGVEATKLIREKKEEYYKKVPIVALTANAISGAREMFLENGFDGFLAKPIELSALDRVLKQYIPDNLQERYTKTTDEKKEEASDEVISLSDQDKKYVDVNIGLSYVGNSKDVYLSIVETYEKNGKSMKEKMERLFAEQDWKNYVIEAHALKSSSLSIGAAELSEMSKGLELNGKSGNYAHIIENHEETMKIYGRVLAICESMLARENANVAEDETENEETASKPIITPEEAEGFVSRLRDAADMFDCDEILKTLSEMSAYVFLDESADQIVADIEKHANGFDYDSVTESADKLLQLVKGGAQ